MMPALEQNRSIRPNALSACLTSASTSAAEAMSVVTAIPRWPPASISAATCAAPAPSRSATTTPAAPWAARARHRARPIPLAPPVTTATEPSGRISAPPRLGGGGPVGPGGQVRIGGDLVGELLPGLLALGGQVLGRPRALVRLVALEHVAGHGDLVHLVHPVGDRHRRRGGVHGLQRGQVGGGQRAHDVQGT